LGGRKPIGGEKEKLTLEGTAQTTHFPLGRVYLSPARVKGFCRERGGKKRGGEEMTPIYK